MCLITGICQNTTNRPTVTPESILQPAISYFLMCKNQRPNFNTLSRFCIIRSIRIRKCSMRSQSRPSIQLILETFDQINLVRIDLALVVELQLWRILDAERFSLTGFVSQCDGDEIILPVHALVIRQRKRMVFDYPINWSPNVDNLDSFVKKLWSVFAGV